MSEVEKFLNSLVTEKKTAAIFLINGVKLVGTIIEIGETGLLLERDNRRQVICLHAVSTVSDASSRLDNCDYTMPPVPPAAR